MEISLLEEFVTLVDSCSFQETAAIVHISQSALTKHIQKLEEQLNHPLFDRYGRNVQVNEFGKCFYPYAVNIIQEYREGVLALENLSELNDNNFTIAYDPILEQYHLLDLITSFTKASPEYKPLTIESYHPITLLKQKKCSFAFIEENNILEQDFNSFNKMIYTTDQLAVLMPKDHALAEHKTVALDQLYGEKFILHTNLTETDHVETSKFLELCSSKKFSPDVVAKMQYTASIVNYVRAGQGIGVLNRNHIPDDIQDIAVVDFDPPIFSYIYMIYPLKLSRQSEIKFLHFVIDNIDCMPEKQ